MDPQVVDQIMNNIKQIFGKMTVTRDKEHNFVGMDIEFKSNGTVEIYIKEYIKRIHRDFWRGND